MCCDTKNPRQIRAPNYSFLDSLSYHPQGVILKILSFQVSLHNSLFGYKIGK